MCVNNFVLILLMAIGRVQLKTIEGILVIGGYGANRSVELYHPESGSVELINNIPFDLQYCEGGYQMEDNRVLFLHNCYSPASYFIDVCRNTTVVGPRRVESRDGAASAYLGSALYSVVVCGGETVHGNGDWIASKSCEGLTNDTTWVTLPTNTDLPTSRNRFTLTTLPDRSLIAVGGAVAHAGPYVTNLDTVDRMWLGTWTKSEALGEATGRYGHGAAWYNGTLHVCGGIQQQGWSVWSCKTQGKGENAWKSAEHLAFPRHCFPLVVYNDELYAVGGGTDTVEKLGEDGTWTMLENRLLHARSCHCAVPVRIECV